MCLVACECWVLFGVVVAKTTIGTVGVLGAFFFNALSTFAFADSIGASSCKVNFAGKVTKTFVVVADVVLTNASCAAVRFAETVDGLANVGIASLWSSIRMPFTVCVASAVDVFANVKFAYADLGCRTIRAILTMVSGGALNFSAYVTLASFDVFSVGAVIAMFLISAVDLGANLFLCYVVEVADVSVVTNMNAISSSTTGVFSGSLGDLESETSAVAYAVGVEGNSCLSSKGVPRVGPSLLTVGLGVRELGATHDHERIILIVWSAEHMLRQLLAFFGQCHDLDVVIAAVFTPVDVHLSEMKGERCDTIIVGDDFPAEIFIITVVLNDNLVTGSDVVVFRRE